MDCHKQTLCSTSCILKHNLQIQNPSSEWRENSRRQKKNPTTKPNQNGLQMPKQGVQKYNYSTDASRTSTANTVHCSATTSAFLEGHHPLMLNESHLPCVRGPSPPALSPPALSPPALRLKALNLGEENFFALQCSSPSAHHLCTSPRVLPNRGASSDFPQWIM